MLSRLWIQLRKHGRLILLAVAGIIGAMVLLARPRKRAPGLPPPSEDLDAYFAALEAKRAAEVARAAIETHVAGAKDEAVQAQLVSALEDPDGVRRRARLIEISEQVLAAGKQDP